jgi:hypothetical protein
MAATRKTVPNPTTESRSGKPAAKHKDPTPVKKHHGVKPHKSGRPTIAVKNGAARVQEKPGHPLVVLDTEQLKLLVKIGCTMDEIVEVLKVSKDTIERRYMADVYAARKERNVVIRRKQYQLAMEGDRTMLVWLGKQWLGQTDQLQLGNNPDNPLTPGGAAPVIELVFAESNGDGRLRTIEGEVVAPMLGNGGSNAGAE